MRNKNKEGNIYIILSLNYLSFWGEHKENKRKLGNQLELGLNQIGRNYWDI